MHTTNLQALSVAIAKDILTRHVFISMFVADAKEHSLNGEKAFAIESYKKANKQRAKLAKLVETQRAIKAALADNARDVRIKAKVAKLVAKAGFVEKEAEVEFTSREIEASLDAMIAAFIPKKPDSRPADHPSFQKK